MGLFYPNQINSVLIGSKTAAGVRTAVALTSSYEAETSPQTTATKTFDVGGHVRVDFALNYTMGAAETSNSIEVKLEWSPEGTNFYRFMNDSTSGATSTLTVREFTYVGINAAASPITFGIDISYKEVVRISVKETGVAANVGSIYVEACLSGK